MACHILPPGGGAQPVMNNLLFSTAVLPGFLSTAPTTAKFGVINILFNAALLPQFVATTPTAPGSEPLSASSSAETPTAPTFPVEHTVTPQEFYIQYVAFLLKQGLISAGSQEMGFIYRHLRELQRKVTQDLKELLKLSARFVAELTPQLGGGKEWIDDWMEHLEGFIKDSRRCACELCTGEPKKWWLGWAEEI